MFLPGRGVEAGMVTTARILRGSRWEGMWLAQAAEHNACGDAHFDWYFEHGRRRRRQRRPPARGWRA